MNKHFHQPLIWGLLLAPTITLQAQRVGIGTVSPTARLHVFDGDLLVSSPGNPPFGPASPDPPASGEGRRLMWYAAKSAFRAGYANADEWDRNQIGSYSLAVGDIVTASGYGSVAIGVSNRASGYGAFAVGYRNEATGDVSATIGEFLFARAAGSLSIGTFNDAQDMPDPVVTTQADRVFQIGIGSNALERRNAMTVLRNGNVGIGELNPVARLHVKNGNVLIESGMLRIGSLGNATGIELGASLLKQQDAGKIQYGGFGGSDNTLNIVGGGINVSGTDRAIKLWSEGGLRVRGSTLPDADNAYSLGQNGLRWNSVWSANGTIQTSDARLKTGISASPYGLEALLKLNPVQYQWKDEPEARRHIGLLAQEVARVIPEAVVIPEADGALGMNYSELIPVLIRAIQQLQQKIEQLEKQALR